MTSVLLVEDDWLIATDHARILCEAGYLVVGPFATVERALAAIDQEHIDVAFLDIELRIQKSYAVAERLQQLAIPFVYISGHDIRDLPASIRARQLLSKPVESARLLIAAQRLAQTAIA